MFTPRSGRKALRSTRRTHGRRYRDVIGCLLAHPPRCMRPPAHDAIGVPPDDRAVVIGSALSRYGEHTYGSQHPAQTPGPPRNRTGMATQQDHRSHGSAVHRFGGTPVRRHTSSRHTGSAAHWCRANHDLGPAWLSAPGYRRRARGCPDRRCQRARRGRQGDRGRAELGGHAFGVRRSAVIVWSQRRRAAPRSSRWQAVIRRCSHGFWPSPAGNADGDLPGLKDP